MVNIITRLIALFFLTALLYCEDHFGLTITNESIPVGSALEITGSLASTEPADSVGKLRLRINGNEVRELNLKVINKKPSSQFYISLLVNPNNLELYFNRNGSYEILIYTREKAMERIHLKKTIEVTGIDLHGETLIKTPDLRLLNFLMTGQLSEVELSPLVNADNIYYPLASMHDSLQQFFQLSRVEKPNLTELEIQGASIVKLYNTCLPRLKNMGLMRHMVAILVARASARCGEYETTKAILLPLIEEEIIPYREAVEDIVNQINERTANK